MTPSFNISAKPIFNRKVSALIFKAPHYPALSALLGGSAFCSPRDCCEARSGHRPFSPPDKHNGSQNR